MWDPFTGTSVMSYRGSSSQARTLCFVRDDYVLTAASNKPLINVWSMQRQVNLLVIEFMLTISVFCLFVEKPF